MCLTDIYGEWKKMKNEERKKNISECAYKCAMKMRSFIPWQTNNALRRWFFFVCGIVNGCALKIIPRSDLFNGTIDEYVQRTFYSNKSSFCFTLFIVWYCCWQTHHELHLYITLRGDRCSAEHKIGHFWTLVKFLRHRNQSKKKQHSYVTLCSVTRVFHINFPLP